jgi:hypothetical protein
MSSEPDEKSGERAKLARSRELDKGDTAPATATEAPAYDVVLVHGATGDGEGARVLRARPGQLEVGEIRPLRQGQPIASGGEVVRLVERPEGPLFYDVKVDYKAPAIAARTHGPAQVATPAYRDSWERTFASPGSKDLN